MVVNRFEIWLVDLNPTVGSEMAKIRPCVIVSPSELNYKLSTVIICAVTSNTSKYDFRPNCRFQNRDGRIAVDHIRGVSKSRLVKKMGVLDDNTAKILSETLVGMFEY